MQLPIAKMDFYIGRTVLLGGVAGVGVLLVATVVITPLVTWIFGGWLDPAILDPLRGQFGALLVNVLVVSWLHAALCEEIVFLAQGADIRHQPLDLPISTAAGAAGAISNSPV